MIAKKSRKGTAKPRLSPADLLRREKAIIQDIKAGLLSYRQIAAKHSVSLPTVNNKARKAGISRGRRPGAKIFLVAPRRGPNQATKKAARKAVKKVARKVVKKRAKKALKPAPKPALPIAAASAPKAVVRRRRRRQAGRPAGASPRAAKTGFLDALREVVLKYHPEVSLLRFEKMLKAVESAVR